MDPMRGARDSDSLPILKLHSWDESALAIPYFKEASLSPSREMLLLYSRGEEAMIVPLRRRFSFGEVCGVPLSTTQDSVARDSEASPQGRDYAVSGPRVSEPTSPFSSEPTSPFSSEPIPVPSDGVDTSPFATPAVSRTGAFFTTLAMQSPGDVHRVETPYFTPASTPLWTPLKSPLLRVAETTPMPVPQDPRQFPFISDVLSFTWGSFGDEYGTNKQLACLKEVLFTVTRAGLFVHAFCTDKNRMGNLGKSISTEANSSGQKARTGDNLGTGTRNGRWKNWGIKKVDPVEKMLDLDREIDSATETTERGKMKRKGFGCLQEDDRGKILDRAEDSEGTEEQHGFVTFAIDAEVEKNADGLEVKFLRASYWPSTAQVVSYNIPYHSNSFTSLVAFCKINGFRVGETVDDPQAEAISSSKSLSQGGSVVDDALLYKLAELFTSPTHDLVGMLMSKQEQDHDMRRVSADKQDSRSSEYVMICRVFEWGLRWISVVDIGNIVLEDTVSCWTSFALAGERLFGLQEGGSVYLWATTTGKLVASLNVVQHCRLDAKLKPMQNAVKSEYRQMEGAEQVCAGGNVGDCDGLSIGASMAWEDEKGMSGCNYERDKIGQGAKKGSTLDNFSPVGMARGLEHRFVHMTVTADCLLIAVTDSQGVVYLVSLDDYFSEYALCRSDTVSPTAACGSVDLRVLSTWAVAGCDIGTQRLSSSLPDRFWLKTGAEAGLRVADSIGQGSTYPEKRNLAGSGGFQKGFMSPRQLFSSSSSGFISRSNLLHCGIGQGCLRGGMHQPLRRVFLPIESVDCCDSLCVNPFVMTRMVHSKVSREFRLIINTLHLSGEVYDDRCVDENSSVSIYDSSQILDKVKGHFIAFCTQGCIHIVSTTGLYVLLPPLSLPRSQLKVSSQGCWWFSCVDSEYVPGNCEKILSLDKKREKIHLWQTEVLDRALIYDGLEEAEHLSLANGWSLQLVRLRRLQLALDYIQSDEIEQALEALVEVRAAEAGVPRVLFSALDLMLNQFGGDNELAQASRLLEIAARFATRLIRKYGMEKWSHHSRGKEHRSLKNYHSEAIVAFERRKVTMGLLEMARFLEVIRRMQGILQTKRRKPNHGKETAVETNLVLLDATDLYEKVSDALLEIKNNDGYGDQTLQRTSSNQDIISVTGILETGDSWDLVESGVSAGQFNRSRYASESAKEMFSRWEKGKVDLAGIVRDALRAGRVPLAVVQLHRLHLSSLARQPSVQSAFKEVQAIGRGIAYELFCKGETAKAMAALRRLGEDIEAVLRELAFGTVSRYLRAQVTKELQRLGCYGIQDMQLLEIVSLLEGVYPNGSFWGSYGATQRLLLSSSTTDEHEESNASLQLICFSDSIGKFLIDCGEIDGVVLGFWSYCNNQETICSIPQDTPACYWAGAAVWLSEWDWHTLDRVILDQPFGGQVSWEASVEYAISCQNWAEVSVLLDSIPDSVLQEGELHVRLDCPDSSASYTSFRQFVNNAAKDRNPGEASASLDLDAVEMIIPRIQIMTVMLGNTCTGWMFQMMEEKLAKNHVFLCSYWYGTQELVVLLARSGVLSGETIKKSSSKMSVSQFSFPKVNVATLHKDASRAIHELVIRYCVRHSLPNFMQLYMDYHSLALDNVSATIIEAVVGDCQWALWLILSRIKGREYDASFANARTILAPKFTRETTDGLDADNFIPTVDDMAEAGGEIMAISTLMYSPVVLQKCLCTGSVNRHDGPSWQCTLENLQPGLQRFATLWRTLVGACFGQDTWWLPMVSPSEAAGPAINRAGLAGYLQWREMLFSSACGDTSLLVMLPKWLPKGVQQLIQLAIQGPVGGGQAFFHGPVEQAIHPAGRGVAEMHVLSWEMALQKSIEEELYASPLEEEDMGVKHHLRRGRALAAFNCLLGLRVQNLNNQGSIVREHVGKLQRGQMHFSSEVHTLLVPLTPNEEKILVGVLPLAIMHYENPVVVAACASFLELCGLPANMLRVDVAALCRISEFHKAIEQSEIPRGGGAPVNGEATDWIHSYGFAGSLARTLADEYMERGVGFLKGKAVESCAGQVSTYRPSKALLVVVKELEKASLLESSKGDGPTAGSWLSNGFGDGSELRAQQCETSERWSLVTNFCNIHNLPISTLYLTALARDNDWVGFLAEAQSEGLPLDLLISVASKEFTDPRLQSHILIVLKGLQSAWQKPVVSAGLPSFMRTLQPGYSLGAHPIMPPELFELLADCEHQKQPGKALLARAKDLRWPLLAIVASCFADVTPLSCLTVWLEITAARETSSIKVIDAAAQIATHVGAAIEVTNALPSSSRIIDFRYNRRNPKRQKLFLPENLESTSVATANIIEGSSSDNHCSSNIPRILTPLSRKVSPEFDQKMQKLSEGSILPEGSEEYECLSKMVAILCEQQKFSPLLRAFELFIPSSSLLPFIRFLQAFSQMRLSEATAHLTVFSARLKEEAQQMHAIQSKIRRSTTAWITAAAVTVADTMLTACPSAYERRCLLQLLANADFGDGGTAVLRYRRLYWKNQLTEPALQQDSEFMVESTDIEDETLLSALEKQGKWEDARMWAHHLELNEQHSKTTVHHVTETQAEAMVAEWKEFLWDLPEERASLWSHCQALFMRHSFPPLQAGMFFLRHAEVVEHEASPSELHGLLLLALQWLSGSITHIPPVYPLHLLRELETRVWLLAVESEVEMQDAKGKPLSPPVHSGLVQGFGQDTTSGTGSILGPIDQTATSIAIIDCHVRNPHFRPVDLSIRETKDAHLHSNVDASTLSNSCLMTKPRRKTKGYGQLKKAHVGSTEKGTGDNEDVPFATSPGKRVEPKATYVLKAENSKVEEPATWEERIGEQELERAILSLLEVGQVSAAKQLQQKLAAMHVPPELLLVEAAQNIAMLSTPTMKGSIMPSMLHPTVVECLKFTNAYNDIASATPLQVLEAIMAACREGCGRGLCRRITAVARVAISLELSFAEAYDKEPTQLLQLLSLKAQDALSEAKLLVETHSMPAASIARILAESFLKGILAAHRGGYMESSQREEGPAPLLWRPSDLLKWGKLCPSEPELGHALMRLVISGHDIPHACEVELLILAYHFYMSSACLDGIDVLLALAVTRVESFVSEGDFPSLARLVTGICDFQALHFILDILIENGQLELLLQKRAAVDAAMESSASIRGFRMAVLSTLKHFNPHDLDAFAMVYNQFDMKHEMAALLESRGHKILEQWLVRHDPEQSEELLEIMRYNVEAAEVYATIDAGNRARWSCARASLVSLQLRMPENTWLNLTETNARRLLVEQSRFQEAFIMAEAYGLNQPAEWVPVLWNQMLHPGWIDQFLGEFVAALPLPASMLMELARFYRAEVTARGGQIDFSKWLTPGGLPLEWARYLGKSFRCLLKYVRDVRLRIQLATLATGFPDVVVVCQRILDKVPDTAGPLILRKGHGGTYLPLM